MEQTGDIFGTIFKIKRFSVHDGPGIRTSVFLKGCPLNCVWCHSPEGIEPAVTIWHDKNLCIGCDLCVSGCPESALSLVNSKRPQVLIDRALCRLNGSCVKNCPTGAISFTGYRISVTEVVLEIEKDRLFYETSGGGVTLTGGEPLFQPDFTAGILKACKQRNISTAIETSLHCSKEDIEKVIEYTDLFLADLKIADPILHLKYTGVNNNQILDNFRLVVDSGKDIIVRVPLIENITDKKENLVAIEELVSNTGKNIKIEFISSNHLARNNYDRLKIPFMHNLL